MVYKKKEIFAQAMEAVRRNNLFFIEDIVAFVPCNKTTFYKLIKPGSNEMNALRDALDENRIKTKSAIRAKLYESPKASELLALYRLICTPEERRLLNQQYVELTGKDGKDIKPEPLQIVVVDRTSAIDEKGSGEGNGNEDDGGCPPEHEEGR